jgi:hypothetical protein
MSGRKEYPISITNVQWERMSRAVSTAQAEARNAERNRGQAEAAARQRIQDMQNRCNQQINGLNRELQDKVKKQADDLRQVQNDYTSRIHQQQAAFEQALHEQQDKMKKQADDLRQVQNDYTSRIRQQQAAFEQALREQKAKLENHLRAERREIQNQINAINNRMKAEHKSQSEIANFWTAQAHIFLNDIDSKYRHRLFFTGEWEGLNSRLRQAEHDAANNLNQVSIATSREVCNRAMELREQVIICETEWTQAFNAANGLLVELKNQLEALEALEYTLPEGRVSAEIDYWSFGALAAVKNEIKTLQETIDKPDALPTKGLEDIITRIKHLDDQIAEAENLARKNFLASQLRREIGAEMEEKLPGWVLEQVLFRGEDERQDLHLIFTHMNGSDKLSLIIQGGQQGKDSARIISDFFCNSHRSGDTRDNWIQEITNVIQGFEPNARPVCTPEYANSLDGNRGVLDVKAIKKAVSDS